jgi:hypothetical protein
MMAGTNLMTLPVEKLYLDPNNPRFLGEALKGHQDLSQEFMTKLIREEDATTTLSKAIEHEGVKNPIVAQDRGDGSYLVIDGNRRVVTCRLLIEEKAPDPETGSFRNVPVLVHPKNASPAEMEILKGVLQEGQRPWGAFEDAAYVTRLRKKFKLEIADIASRLQLADRDVERQIEDFKLFEEYSKKTGDTDTSRFSYFGEAPAPVRKWWEESQKQKEQYFGLICPLDEKKNKIRSAAFDLREFKKVLPNKEAVQQLISDPEVSLEDAVDIAEQADIELAAPFLKQLGSWAAKLRSLDEAQVELLANSPKIKIDLHKLRDAADSLLKRVK